MKPLEKLQRNRKRFEKEIHQVKDNKNKLLRWKKDGYPPLDLNNELKSVIDLLSIHEELVKENEELKEWKEQQIKLTAPILGFMGNNSDKFNLRVGDSIFKKVLEILKQGEEK